MRRAQWQQWSTVAHCLIPQLTLLNAQCCLAYRTCFGLYAQAHHRAPPFLNTPWLLLATAGCTLSLIDLSMVRTDCLKIVFIFWVKLSSYHLLRNCAVSLFSFVHSSLTWALSGRDHDHTSEDAQVGISTPSVTLPLFDNEESGHWHRLVQTRGSPCQVLADTHVTRRRLKKEVQKTLPDEAEQAGVTFERSVSASRDVGRCSSDERRAQDEHGLEYAIIRLHLLSPAVAAEVTF
jgi:hypothetical protein